MREDRWYMVNVVNLESTSIFIQTDSYTIQWGYSFRIQFIALKITLVSIKEESKFGKNSCNTRKLMKNRVNRVRLLLMAILSLWIIVVVFICDTPRKLVTSNKIICPLLEIVSLQCRL